MAAQIPTIFNDIQPIIHTQTYLALGIDTNAVRWVQEGEKIQEDVDTQCLIVVGQAETDRESMMGGGRFCTVHERMLYWNLRVRSGEADPRSEDTIGLFNSTYGYFIKENPLYDAFEDFWVEDADKNTLTIFPIQAERASDPRRHDIGFFQGVIQALVAYQLATNPFRDPADALTPPP